MYSRSRANRQGVREIAPGILLVSPVVLMLNIRQEMLQVAEIYDKLFMNITKRKEPYEETPASCSARVCCSGAGF